MSDCAICCVNGLTPSPSTADPCVCNAGKGAIFVGTTGFIYIRKTISTPCNANDWQLLTAAVGGASVIQDEAIAGGPTQSIPLTGAPPTSYGIQSLPIVTIVNPSTYKHLYIHIVSNAYVQLTNLAGTANVDFRNYIRLNGDNTFWNKYQSVSEPSQVAATVTVSRVFDILPLTELDILFQSIALVYAGAANVAGCHIQYSYQIVAIG